MVRKSKTYERNVTAARRTRKKPTVARRTVSRALAPDEVKKRTEQKAFELFERRGCQHGWHDYDWSMAEHLIKLEAGKQSRSRFKAPSPDTVQRKAYEIFAGRGFMNGQDSLDWYLAEEFAKYETK